MAFTGPSCHRTVSKQRGPVPGVAAPSRRGQGGQVPGCLVAPFQAPPLGLGAGEQERGSLTQNLSGQERVAGTGPGAQLCPLTRQAAHEAPGQGADGWRQTTLLCPHGGHALGLGSHTPWALRPARSHQHPGRVFLADGPTQQGLVAETTQT